MSKFSVHGEFTYLTRLMPEQKLTPVLDVSIEIKFLPAVLINGSKHEEGNVKELLGCILVIDALRDQRYKISPEVQCKVASGRCGRPDRLVKRLGCINGVAHSRR